MPENPIPKSVRKILKNLRNFADLLRQPKLKQKAKNISKTKTSSSTNLSLKKNKKKKTNKKPMRLCLRVTLDGDVVSATAICIPYKTDHITVAVS